MTEALEGTHAARLWDTSLCLQIHCSLLSLKINADNQHSHSIDQTGNSGSFKLDTVLPNSQSKFDDRARIYYYVVYCDR